MAKAPPSTNCHLTPNSEDAMRREVDEEALRRRREEVQVNPDLGRSPRPRQLEKMLTGSHCVSKSVIVRNTVKFLAAETLCRSCWVLQRRESAAHNGSENQSSKWFIAG